MSTQIEHRIEAEGEQPDYSGREFTEDELADGAHRRFIGGVWDTHGETQLNYLKSRGLQPEHRLLDIGCGPFRAGRHLIDYLDSGHYYGVEANHSLIQAGYDRELSDAQRAKVPPTNLRANDRFDGDFGVEFDFAMAQSVWTHVSLNHIRLCLYRVAKVMRPGGEFYATVFERSHKTPVDYIVPSKAEKPFFTEKNVFWYYADDIAWAAEIGPWEFEFIGQWGHPANQKMCRFVRLTDEEWKRRRAAAAAPAAPPAPQPSAADRARSYAVRGLRSAARRLDNKG